MSREATEGGDAPADSASSLPGGLRTRAVAGVVVLALVVLAGLLVSPATVMRVAEGLTADPLVFLAFLAGCYLVRPALAWPTTPLAVLAGYGLGLWGVPASLVGVGITAVPTYLAAGWFGRGSATVDRASVRIERYFDASGPFRGTVAARLAPIPADLVTCAAAFAEVRLRWLVAGTVVGEVPWTVAAVVVGASAGRLATAGVDAVGLPVIAGCLLGAAVLLAGPLYREFGDDLRSV